MDVIKALMGVLNAPIGATPYPLRILARPRYLREVILRPNSDNTITIFLAKYGHHYKYHGKKHQIIQANTEGIKQALNNSLPHWITVNAVTDCGEKIELLMEVKNHE